MINRFGFALAGAVSLLGLSVMPAAQASVTVVADYHLGEADGAAAGSTSTGTADSSGNGHNLGSVIGAPIYSSDTPYLSGYPSTLSANFDGGSYLSGPTVSNATENFGIEAWVKWSFDGGDTQGIAINGSGCCSGFGLFESGSAYYGLYGGVNIIPIADATSGWVEIALVNQNGITTTYLNGVAQVTDNYGDPNPADFPTCCAPPLAMTIGSDGSNNFNGLIDEVRVFTFADGAFSASDLNVRVPEPASIALLGAGLAGFAARRRKARRG